MKRGSWTGDWSKGKNTTTKEKECLVSWLKGKKHFFEKRKLKTKYE